ncbi:MAG: sulfatase-like hydrolase/transferase [Planctomycetaceae bacterium]|nr:sulfatase-like hydrolase/transferase [Planctomycetaceae bacterium]
MTTLIVPWLLLLACEWDHYRRLLQWSSLPTSLWDRVTLMWVLVAKSLWAILPVLALAVVVRRAGYRRISTGVWLMGLGCVMLWLLLDLRVQAITGNHLLTYFNFICDPHAWQWAGDVSRMLVSIVALFAAVAVAGTLADCAAIKFARSIAQRWPWLTQSLGRTAACAALLGFACGAGPAHWGVSSRLAVERLHATLPWNPFAFLVAAPANCATERVRVELNMQLQNSLARQIETLRQPGPVDTQVVDVGSQPPHIVIFLLESLRHDVWQTGMMPRTAAWAKDGLQLDRHYAGSNCSHLGLFGLLYARSPLVYHTTLDAQTTPQACETLRRAGYECSYIASGTIQWMRMNEYIRPPAFQHISTDERPDWVRGDRDVLAKVREQLAAAKQPQFIVCFLNATHFPYLYPTEFATHAPVVPPEDVCSSTIERRAEVMNRYRNAAAFLDHEVAETIATLDPAKHLIVVAGDHGESHFDDGTLSHWGKLSEMQCRTPLAIVGPGVMPMRLGEATTHADVLPTLLHALTGQQVPLANTHGRDLLAAPVDDRALIATMTQSHPLEQKPFWDAMLLAGDRRLSLRISLKEPLIQSLGYLDVDGKYDPHQTADAAEATAWATLVDSHLERVAGRVDRREPSHVARQPLIDTPIIRR